MAGPGKSHRIGISLVELFDMFPDEDAARKWFEETRWPNGRACAKCGSVTTSGVPNATPMPYWCSDCRSYFSVKLGTVMQGSNLPMRKWAIAIYLVTTNLKGVSSMKLHRDLKIRQATAWHMLHRIRKAMQGGDPPVQWAGRGGRNLHRRERVQQARVQEAAPGARAGWQGRRRWGQGPRDESGNRHAGSLHGQGDASRIRA